MNIHLLGDGLFTEAILPNLQILKVELSTPRREEEAGSASLGRLLDLLKCCGSSLKELRVECDYEERDPKMSDQEPLSFP